MAKFYIVPYFNRNDTSQTQGDCLSVSMYLNTNGSGIDWYINAWKDANFSEVRIGMCMIDGKRRLIAASRSSSTVYRLYNGYAFPYGAQFISLASSVTDSGNRYWYGLYSNEIISPEFASIIDFDLLTSTISTEAAIELMSLDNSIPITYIPISSILNGPAQANTGDAVEVDVSFPDGYKLKDATQGSGISVYYDNGYIDFTYDEATRKLRFTMPN